MTADRSRGLCGVVALFVFCGTYGAPVAHADSRIWLGSLNYESARLAVPVVRLLATDDSGKEWSAGLTGWTLSVDWKMRVAENQKRHLFVRLTPLNAHGSNYAYRDGRRDAAGEYKAASLAAGGGIEIAHTRRWTGGYRTLAAYERVSGLPSEAQAFWDKPFIGVEVTQNYSRTTADDLFGSRSEGVKLEASAQMFTGSHTWSRVQATAGAGKRHGPVFVAARSAIFGGQSLNKVSAFLIGGSWDLAVPELLPGYRYAEFRVDRAATIGGALDWRLHGSVEVGFRGAYLKGKGLDEYGAAVQLMTVWKGAVLNAGAALPKPSLSRGRWDRVVVFATVTAAVIQR
jgi:hypothetical protein